MTSDIIKLSFSGKTSTRVPSEYAVPVSDDIKMSDLYGRSEDATDAIGQVQGWSNQELADLYRTHRLLGLAGISTEVDRGLTDEGDPWFVFMDSQNDVFVHFSRFDDVYMVASQVQKAPIWGRSLADLVTEFSKSVQPATKADNDRSNVVSIARRNPNVVMVHPGAALAALVWSIYLMTDELVAAPIVALSSMEELPQTDISEKLADIDVLPDLAKKAMITLFDPSLSKQAAENSSYREAGLGAQLANLYSGMSMKAIGVGLSFAAIAAGLPLIETMSKGATTQANDTSLSEKQLYALITDAKEAGAIVSDLASAFKDVAADLHDLAKSSVSLSNSLVIQSIDDTSDLMQVVTTSYKVEEAAFSSGPHSAATLVQEVKAVSVDNTPIQIFTSTGTTTTLVSTDLLLRFDEAFDTFQLTSLDTLTEQEWTQLMAMQPVADAIISRDSFINLSSYTPYDDDAEMYLEYLLQSYGEADIKVVNLPNEIIFIHIDSLDSASADNTIYAKSWSLENGDVISIIGLRSDLEMFNLVI